jgi:hypothetical protein
MHLTKSGWSAGKSKQGINAWTDQFSNIISVIGNETGQARLREKKQKNDEKI